MIHIAPFSGVRPAADKVHLVASRSYVSYSPAQLRRKLEENPFSFIHIINPEFNASRKSARNSNALFKKVKAKYQEFLANGIFQMDEKPALYIYHQAGPYGIYTGLICGISVEDYRNGSVKIHEQTITAREEIFCKYLDICDFNAEPVLLAYTENKADLKLTMAAKMTENPLYDFSTTDRTRHQLWKIDDEATIQHVIKDFQHSDKLYIADGHHRMASSARLSEMRKKRGETDSEHPKHEFALALILAGEDLSIQPFHRLINMGTTMTEQAILERLKTHFILTPSNEKVIPDEKRTWGLKLISGWYLMRLKEPLKAEKQVDMLDAMIVTKLALEPVFQILDQKTDNRIRFIPGNESLEPHERAVDLGALTAILTLYPVSREELFAVADAHEIMPPKSTWIAPKLRSGLTIMPLS